jgi:hypothetical protein
MLDLKIYEHYTWVRTVLFLDMPASEFPVFSHPDLKKKMHIKNEIRIGRKLFCLLGLKTLRLNWEIPHLLRQEVVLQ